MVGFGAMMSLISTGSRIASEQTEGWTRRLRITPLPADACLRAKLAAGYAIALSTIALLSTAGLVLGVRLPAVRWLEMVGLLLIGLLPFAALGVLLGHLVTADMIGCVAWSATGWLVIGSWTLVLGALARAAFRRDNERA